MNKEEENVVMQAVNENTLLCFQPVSDWWETVVLLGGGILQNRIIERIQFTSSLTQEECYPDFMLLLKGLV